MGGAGGGDGSRLKPGDLGAHEVHRSSRGGQLGQGRGELGRPVAATDIEHTRIQNAHPKRACNMRNYWSEPIVVKSGPVSSPFGPPMGFGL